MSRELKHCPFCPSARIVVEDLGGGEPAYVRCDGCGADGPPRPKQAEAIEAGQTRFFPESDGGRQ
jgi:Pyruvate/2-oxoacid:ferredoxin oxidoreductase delta subunit